jgi:para-nitrobenzyl esterase
LRWKAPQPAPAWTGVRKAVEFGPRCIQDKIFPDMVFRDPGPSEDCLTLNVWAPEAAFAGKSSQAAKLPVMFWVFGGGYMAGGTSEPRQDGGNLAPKGVVVVSCNYRLGIFGFFTHPEAAKESKHHSAGNYGLLDQVAALQWVRKNIARFGGDPANVTIFGESAGSFSVSGLVLSPLAKGLFRRAIGESGAMLGEGLGPLPLQQAEENNVKFAQDAFGTASLATLRSLPAAEVQQAAREKHGRFLIVVDGWYLPQPVRAIYAAGKQNHVALLAGWNADEARAAAFFGGMAPTAESFAAVAHERYKDRAAEFLKLYPASTDAEALRSAGDIASDNFIALGTWRWIELHTKTPGVAVYRYHFEQKLPSTPPAANHSGEIEYVFRTLASKNLPFTDEDRRVSEMLASYWTNFAKTGDPNGEGLAKWPVYREADGYQVMHLKANSAAAPDGLRGRYLFLDSLDAASR